VQVTEELGLYDKPAPLPPECKTEAEQTAYAFGWWKALESVRVKQPAQAPQPRSWVGLTEKEIDNFFKAVWGPKVTPTDFIRSIEQALKEKNT
jgi:hypothetical protein